MRWVIEGHPGEGGGGILRDQIVNGRDRLILTLAGLCRVSDSAPGEQQSRVLAASRANFETRGGACGRPFHQGPMNATLAVAKIETSGADIGIGSILGYLSEDDVQQRPRILRILSSLLPRIERA